MRTPTLDAWPRELARGEHDDRQSTVRLVRYPDGSAVLVVIRCACPWVLRRPWLRPEDVD